MKFFKKKKTYKLKRYGVYRIDDDVWLNIYPDEREGFYMWVEWDDNEMFKRGTVDIDVDTYYGLAEAFDKLIQHGDSTREEFEDGTVRIVPLNFIHDDNGNIVSGEPDFNNTQIAARFLEDMKEVEEEGIA